MNEREFLAAVYLKTPPHLKYLVGDAIECLQRGGRIKGPYSKADVANFIMFLPQLEQERSQKKRETETFSLAPSPTEGVASEVLAKRVSPRVDALREEIFGDKNPPFKTWDEAYSWICEEEVKEPQGVDLTYAFEFPQEELRRCAVEEFSTDRSVRISDVRYRYLWRPWPLKEDVWRWGPIPVGYTTKLGRLKDLSEELAKQTGWEEGEVLMHILTGENPRLYPILEGSTK